MAHRTAALQGTGRTFPLRSHQWAFPREGPGVSSPRPANSDSWARRWSAGTRGRLGEAAVGSFPFFAVGRELAHGSRTALFLFPRSLFPLGSSSAHGPGSAVRSGSTAGGSPFSPHDPWRGGSGAGCLACVGSLTGRVWAYACLRRSERNISTTVISQWHVRALQRVSYLPPVSIAQSCLRLESHL